VASPEYLPAPRPVTVRTARVNDLLGTSLSDAAIAALLAPFGFATAAVSDGVQVVTIPTWRPDSTREIDVIEEVARMHGYRNIARSLPPGVRTGGGLTPYQRQRRRLLDASRLRPCPRRGSGCRGQANGVPAQENLEKRELNVAVQDNGDAVRVDRDLRVRGTRRLVCWLRFCSAI
jgi:hypothetical protein